MLNKKNTSAILVMLLVFGLSVILRIIFTSQGSTLFSYDQARDAIMANQILSGDLKIMGPPSSILQGLSHGVLWYYVLAAINLFSKGNPVISAYIYSVIISLSIIPIYLLGGNLSKDKRIGVLSALFWAVSFEGVQYSTWLSNPSMAFIFVPLIYLGLWGWTEKKNILFAALTGLGLGLSIQSNLFLVYHLIPVGLWLLINKKNVSLKSVFVALFFLILSTSTMILEQIKFGFGGIKGAMFVLSGSDYFIQNTGFGDFLVNYLNQLGVVFSNNLLPYNVAFGGLLGLTVVIFTIRELIITKKRWLAIPVIYFFSQIIISMFGGVSTPYIGVAIGIPFLIMVSYLLVKIFDKSKFTGVVLVIIILLMGITSVFVKSGKSAFAIQEEMRINNETALIDYTYQSSEGKPFSINSVTAPLWMNVTWSYLYKWYGMEKYGYLPNYVGRDQIGQIDQLQQGEPQDLIYLIVEPGIAIPQRYIDATIAEENTRSKIIEEKKWGTLIVQKRILK